MRERTWYRRSSIRPARSERADSIRAILRPNATSFRPFSCYRAGTTPLARAPPLPGYICKCRVAPICGAMQDSALSVSWGEGGVVMEDRIEQRITIRATHDKVWQLVTRPGWWLPGSDAEPARGPGRVSVTYSGDVRPYGVD